MDIQYLTLSEGKIAYDVTGSGPLVVCVPGMGELRQNYRFLTPRLVSVGYRVVTMDVRGHGETSPAWTDVSVAGIGSDIAGLIRHLDAGPAVVIGNSMAAGAAVWAAVEAPEWVRAVVLSGPVVRGETGRLVKLLYQILFARPWGPSAWLMYYKTLYPASKPADWNEYSQRLKENLSQPGRVEALQRMMCASKAASAARLVRVDVPTLVIMGSKDPDFKDPEAEARWVAEQIKGSMRMIAGAGHYPQTEMPDITTPVILDFLKTIHPEAAFGTPDP